MKAKRLVSIALAAAALCSFALAGCSSKGEGDVVPATEPSVRLRSNAEQALKVGESMNIVYSTANTDEGVTFTSSDEDVVTVSAYGEVMAVGVGEATVTLALVEDPSKTAVVSYTVTKNFFMDESGYRNGQVDLTEQDSGIARITGGQAQILVNDAGRTWYFSCHITHDGVVAGDSAGGWGVGSFLVNAAYAIGDVMYWYALRRVDDTHCRLYYGGWRYDASVSASHEEPVTDTVIDISNGVDFTIYRSGITHYMILEYLEDGETKTIKHSYDVPLFETYDTFPGVFAQNQALTVTDYVSSGDPDEVAELLSGFQLAESVEINTLDSRLVRGQSYELTSTVLPDYTIDKGVTYTLDTAVSGVTLEGNVLTVSEDCTASEITVIATAVSDPGVTDRKTYSVISKPSSTSTRFDTGMVVGEGVTFGMDGASATASGEAYIPLTEIAQTWYLEATVNTDAAGTEAGLMSASAGYTYRSAFGVSYANARVCAAIYRELGGTQTSVTAAANGLLASGGGVNTLGLLKQGDTYTLFINGKMIERYTAYEGMTIPVLYTTGAAQFTDVAVTTDESEIAALLAENPFFTGAYVTRSGETGNIYELAGMNFTGTNMNWPPDNDYQNGLKYAQSLTGDFEISFTMSGITPLVQGDGSIDAKVLIYLRSESTTCSLQFVIKEYDGEVGVKFVANLNDNSWTEYDIPAIEGVDLLNGITQVRIVRTQAGVELYLNGTAVFADEAFMRNSSYWNASTVSTPGIGSFLCAVTITDPVISSVE